MKASIKWLKEFVDFSQSPSELDNILTMTGLEVENIIPNDRDGKDSILEISVTPNRPDCLSIRGIAREVSAVLNLPFKDIPVSVKKVKKGAPSIKVNDQDLCMRYASRIIRGVKVRAESPKLISSRLEAHGIRPVNNIVDITNYVLLEMGHPLHAFDLDKLEGKRIVVKRAGSEDKFQTLDNEERILKKDTLVVCDAKRPVAIAGVMGGLNTEVEESTVDILLESAYFDPLSIRRASKALNLSTESSYRFERGADINCVVPALDRTAQLIMEVAGGEVSALTDIYPKRFKPKRISVSHKKINNILGVNIRLSEVLKLLNGLEFKTKTEAGTAGSKEKKIIVIPPSFRPDIQKDIDVIEEVARLYGYDKIPVTLPVFRMQPSDRNTRWDFTKRVKHLIAGAGYSEVINYSFLNPSDLDKLKIPEKDSRRNLIKIRNPLRSEDEAMRTTLVPLLLDNIRLNASRGEKQLRLFELSTVFHNGRKGHLPDEALKLAAVYSKNNEPALWQSAHDGFYDLKGAVESLFIGLGIRDYSFDQDAGSAEQYLHPGKSCVIKIDNGPDPIIGSLGTIHPDVAHNFDITPETVVLELDIERLAGHTPAAAVYKPLPRFPYVERDLAVIVSADVTTAQVKTTIQSISSDIIESVRLFDIYSGKPIPKGKKSMAFSIRYRAGDRTLTDIEVNEIHSKILKLLEDSLKAELRG